MKTRSKPTLRQRFWLLVWRTFERFGWPNVAWAPWVMERMMGKGRRVDRG